MEILKGDLWDFHAKGWKIVISTNIGWTDQPESWREVGYRGSKERVPVGRAAPLNNMGAGIAWQASWRWPWLPEWLGSHYRARHLLGGLQMPVEHDQLRLIFVAVKPLIESDPAYSWNQKASPELIKQQLGMLSRHQGNIALGFVGCGNGALEQAQVLPSLLRLEIARQHNGHGKTIVVDREAA